MGYCLWDQTPAGDDYYCTRYCNAFSPCDEGYACDESEPTYPVCRKVPAPIAPAMVSAGGCAVGGGDGTDGGDGIAMLLASIGVLVRRRAKRL